MVISLNLRSTGYSFSDAAIIYHSQVALALHTTASALVQTGRNVCWPRTD